MSDVLRNALLVFAVLCAGAAIVACEDENPRPTHYVRPIEIHDAQRACFAHGGLAGIGVTRTNYHALCVTGTEIKWGRQ